MNVGCYHRCFNLSVVQGSTKIGIENRKPELLVGSPGKSISLSLRQSGASSCSTRYHGGNRRCEWRNFPRTHNICSTLLSGNHSSPPQKKLHIKCAPRELISIKESGATWCKEFSRILRHPRWRHVLFELLSSSGRMPVELVFSQNFPGNKSMS
jgi:hypothetical protein